MPGINGFKMIKALQEDKTKCSLRKLKYLEENIEKLNIVLGKRTWGGFSLNFHLSGHCMSNLRTMNKEHLAIPQNIHFSKT